MSTYFGRVIMRRTFSCHSSTTINCNQFNGPEFAVPIGANAKTFTTIEGRKNATILGAETRKLRCTSLGCRGADVSAGVLCKAAGTCSWTIGLIAHKLQLFSYKFLSGWCQQVQSPLDSASTSVNTSERNLPLLFNLYLAPSLYWRFSNVNAKNSPKRNKNGECLGVREGDGRIKLCWKNCCLDGKAFYINAGVFIGISKFECAVSSQQPNT
ncbi:uncharacterized protein [Heterodontus francisci]|uniref:uncharacterized protein n=1 Tax=Heterodontus francisci TaxID=7792 RepID=UPI00355BE5C8